MTATTDAPSGSLVTQDGHVLIVPVSDPGAGTAMSRDTVLDGTAALQAIARGDRDARVLLLIGHGPNFCAGGNVRAFAAADDRPAFLRGLADDAHAFVRAIYEADIPVVVAAKKWAAGVGMSFVLHGDIVIGGPSTKLQPAYGGIGLSPDGGMSWTLPRAIGAARARNVILTNRTVTADEALAWGILSEIVDDDQVDAVALERAHKLAAGPAKSIRATRKLLSASVGNSLSDQLNAEARSISVLSGQPEGIEGVDAFVGKRKPNWG
ncbi:enoyl-CoA hydratase/isomerase family protein [Gordonia amarae]|uniref:Enoyl-CoA hydratase/isomerase family protein n=2 Tax=Gordonia amarae TaxID=36821 RepID=A0A857KLF0_9ACTN|nr:enoyl-CoA hydratase-related protein [Gordonia amarae]MCS3879821.1 2-(1,2-epoxy-1,2-dihydrophenyl)acetyl-CoA isomerase [Gordonia amarae]QHN18241.1 enoyl-CoA hydratase/isomerase family protein [Gordonia amarae]QHN22725.1 enoyl-CoA hydratase/isomerase family protein [Gordonia amarae]QHN31628.1 enoyl-CoA hydratase/isomerase family protein [Gordonia amarae]QHN40372.1 enoyl-CoA hydratase/isomerase family protein [Gordonia amarae]